MQIITKIFPANFDLFCLSDAHRGSILHHYNGWYRALDEIRSKESNRVIFGGDLIEGICIDDPRMNVETQDMDLITPVKQCKSIVRDLLPIKDQIVGILDGNHEVKLSNKAGNLARDIICYDLFGDKRDMVYATYSMKLVAKDKAGNVNWKMFYTHGYGSINSIADDPIRRDANMKLSLKRKLQNKFGDCVVMAMGHCHQLLVAEPTHELYMIDDGEKIKQKFTRPSMGDGERIDPALRYYAATGSFLKTFHLGASSYSERFGYNPTLLGYIVIHVRDKQVVGVEAREL